MAKTNKHQMPFALRGIDLNASADMLREGYVPFVRNFRRLTADSITPRPGLGSGIEVVVGQSPVHSIRRLNDSSTGSTAVTEIVGTGTALATVNEALNVAGSIDTGYSSDPLSIVTFRPQQSVKKWAYVADSLRMRKVDQAGNLKTIGLSPPTAQPTLALDVPKYKLVDPLDDHIAWTASGTASAKADHTRVDPLSRSVTAILYDSGSTGWCSIRPSSMADIGERSYMEIGGSENFFVQKVLRGSAATTIDRISYESGSSGLCSIHLATPVEEIEVDSMILLDSGGADEEYVRVLSVHRTKDNRTSFRCSTVNTQIVSHTAEIVHSFRAYLAGTFAAAATLGSVGVEFDVVTGTGRISQTVSVDLSSIAAGIPTRPDDYMGIDLFIDKPELVSEIKVYLDISSAVNNFTEDAFIHILRANDFTPVLVGDQTDHANRQIRLQRDLIQKQFDQAIDQDSSPGPRLNEERLRKITEDPSRPDLKPELRDPDSIAASQNTWSGPRWRIGKLLAPDVGRVGSDMSRGLKDVDALRIEFITTGDVSVVVGPWWIGGGFGPDVTAAGAPRIYRYRHRDSETGAVSNWSPASFGGIDPKRQKVLVTLDSSSVGDKLDIQVRGEQMLGWFFAGSVANSGTPQFEDTFSSEFLSKRVAFSDTNRNYQLWPQIRPPISGSNATVSGNLVTLSGGEVLLTGIAPGTAIVIDGKDYTIHELISTSKFYLTESGGSVSASDWEAAEPLVQGQPLPILAGPFFGFFFGLGDPYNPQRLYYTNGNDPDSTQDTNYIDVEGEILQNIVIVEGRAILFSTERAFGIEPAFTLAQSGGGLFSVREIPNSVGLWARWACCEAEGEAIFLSKDGIYSTSGGTTRLLSQDLRPLFPKGASLGTTVNGITPPNMIAANDKLFRLSYVDRELYFDYYDTSNNRQTLVNERAENDQWLGWLPYTYTPGVALHYGEEGENVHGTLVGTSDGFIFRLGNEQSDNGAAIAASIQLPDLNFGDARMSKYFLDTLIDYELDGDEITVTPGFSHRSPTLTPTTISAPLTGRAQQIIDFNSGQGQRGKDISLLIETEVTTARPVLYLVEFNFSVRPDSTLLRAEDYELKQDGVIWARGVWIYADTSGVDRTAVLEYTKDDGTVASEAITGINHAQLTERYYPLELPVYLIASRIRPTDADSWEYSGHRIDGEKAPPLSDGPTPWTPPEPGFIGARFVQGVRVDIDTEGANVDLGVQVDENVLETTIDASTNKGPANSNGRAILPFSFDTPFITHLIRLNPESDCRIFGVEWISEPEPELAYMWWGQQTDLGVLGFKYLGDGWVSVRSTNGSVVLELIADGVSYLPTFFDASTDSSGNRRTYRFRCPPIKAKNIQPKIYASGAVGKIAVYQKEFHIEFKPWGFEGGWQIANLLGDAHYQSGARI